MHSNKGQRTQLTNEQQQSVLRVVTFEDQRAALEICKERLEITNLVASYCM